VSKGVVFVFFKNSRVGVFVTIRGDGHPDVGNVADLLHPRWSYINIVQRGCLQPAPWRRMGPVVFDDIIDSPLSGIIIVVT